MKRRRIFIILAIITVLIFIKVSTSSGEKTIEEAIHLPNLGSARIIHEEKNNKGSIVFNYISEGNGLHVSVVRKVIGGYKEVYCTTHGGIKVTLEKRGFLWGYFPKIKGTELPVYYGIIGDDNISSMKVIEKKRNIEKEAEIIDAEGTRIWLVYMDGFQGSDFDIVALSRDGKELRKISDDISPWYAEQKAFKGYE